MRWRVGDLNRRKFPPYPSPRRSDSLRMRSSASPITFAKHAASFRVVAILLQRLLATLPSPEARAADERSPPIPTRESSSPPIRGPAPSSEYKVACCKGGLKNFTSKLLSFVS